jgi:CheY-like chemotaxis protein
MRDLVGVHVLVVEDTDDSREVLRVALEYCGALVTTAESAQRPSSYWRRFGHMSW